MKMDSKKYDKEPSSLARGKAALAWCESETSSIEMDVRLAEEFARILDQYICALQWCSGSSDFGPGGLAREGWTRTVQPLINEG